MEESKSSTKNRAHPDLTVENVDIAVEQAAALGATRVRAKDTYPLSAGTPSWSGRSWPIRSATSSVSSKISDLASLLPIWAGIGIIGTICLGWGTRLWLR